MKKSVRKQRKSLRNKRRNTKKHSRKTKVNTKKGGWPWSTDPCKIVQHAKISTDARRNKTYWFDVGDEEVVKDIGYIRAANPLTEGDYNAIVNMCTEQHKKKELETRRREEQMDRTAKSKLTHFTLDPIENPKT